MNKFKLNKTAVKTGVIVAVIMLIPFIGQGMQARDEQLKKEAVTAYMAKECELLGNTAGDKWYECTAVNGGLGGMKYYTDRGCEIAEDMSVYCADGLNANSAVATPSQAL